MVDRILHKRDERERERGYEGSVRSIDARISTAHNETRIEREISYCFRRFVVSRRSESPSKRESGRARYVCVCVYVYEEITKRKTLAGIDV